MVNWNFSQQCKSINGVFLVLVISFTCQSDLHRVGFKAKGFFYQYCTVQKKMAAVLVCCIVVATFFKYFRIKHLYFTKSSPASTASS